MSEECLFIVNERSSVTIGVAFLDDANAPVTPTTATYRIDDHTERAQILDTTDIPSLDDTVDLEITADQNRILRNRNEFEVKTVTVEYDYGDDKHGTAEYRYKVLNLYGVTTP